MMRALWTAASGMKAQQTSMDNISNNLANINTTGFKKETVGFQSLLYQTIQETTTNANGEPKPIGAQVGLGVKVASISTSFDQGTAMETGGDFDFLIQGKGLFMVEMPDGSTGYTRNGHFVMAVNAEGGLSLTTSDGYSVLDGQGKPIKFESDVDVSKLNFDNYGNIMYEDNNGNYQNTGVTIGLAQFNNPSGLEKIGDSYYAESEASGTPRIEGQDPGLKRSTVKNGYLEASSVQSDDEMVDMNVTQRAYEMNSKAITASDEMLQQANNLRS